MRKPKPTMPPPSPPSPGSDAALDLGCRCPVMDNNRGRGSMYGKGVFVMNADCPLHGSKVPQAGRPAKDGPRGK